MKKILILSVIMISLVAVRLNVNAAATNAVPGQDEYNNLKSLYDNGITTTNISGSDWVTIYGKSICDSNGSCKHYYVNEINDFKTVLKKSVKCSNGEKYIAYAPQIASGKNDSYTDSSNTIVKDVTVYWSENIYVTCTSDNGNGSVQLENQVSNNTNAGNDYNSADQGEQEELGVNTYFVVLGIVAIISYGFILLTKKFNLFKKI